MQLHPHPWRCSGMRDLWDAMLIRTAGGSVLYNTRLGARSITYDHRCQRIRDPVCSPRDKLTTAGSVVGWVTTSESPVLYVIFFFFFFVLLFSFVSNRSSMVLSGA
jgi:hypothetical protein